MAIYVDVDIFALVFTGIVGHMEASLRVTITHQSGGSEGDVQNNASDYGRALQGSDRVQPPRHTAGTRPWGLQKQRELDYVSTH